MPPGTGWASLGWKYLGPDEAAKPDSWLETPAYVADTLRKIVGAEGRVSNANALLMDCATGLRAVNEVEQIAQFEFGAVMASEALKALFRAIKPGIRRFVCERAWARPSNRGCWVPLARMWRSTSL